MRKAALFIAAVMIVIVAIYDYNQGNVTRGELFIINLLFMIYAKLLFKE